MSWLSNTFPETGIAEIFGIKLPKEVGNTMNFEAMIFSSLKKLKFGLRQNTIRQ